MQTRLPGQHAADKTTIFAAHRELLDDPARLVNLRNELLGTHANARATRAGGKGALRLRPSPADSKQPTGTSRNPAGSRTV